ncbi:MAG TPA: gliding motility-associated C-terminal domain-containing protein [Thermoanaerobaculia bacterium]|jgi:gliding motility-associated-like protein
MKGPAHFAAMIAAIVLLFPLTAEAQRPPVLCDGIPGPSKFHIDFGRGPNPGPPLPPGVTSYDYLNQCAISPGEYAIRNSMMNCRRDWFSIPEDHTPNDVDGYFMAVDSTSERVVFQRRVDDLIPGAIYIFSGAAANLAPGARANITFRMEDTRGGLLSEANVALALLDTFQWQEGAASFRVPLNTTSVVLKLITNRTQDVGNDFLIDDLDFSICYSPAVASFSATALETKAKACDSGSVNLYAQWPPSGNPFVTPGYQWQRSTDGGATWTDIPGATSQNATNFEPAPGIYDYRIVTYEFSNPSRRMASAPIQFHVVTVEVEPLEFTFYACEGTDYMLEARAHFLYDDPNDPIPGDFSFLWSPADRLDNPASPMPVISLPPLSAPNPVGPAPAPLTFTYGIAASHPFSCFGQGQTTVRYFNPRKVFVPNAFTPNGDGRNDVFGPHNLVDYPGATFRVYNRWGAVVFESSGPDFNWDGTYHGVPQPSGTFAWRVEMPFCKPNIYSATNGDGVAHGTVTLIR